MFIAPDPESDFHLTLGDRVQAIALGFAYGVVGTLQALAYAMVRYRRIRFPDVGSYPTSLINAGLTAFIDEATFRGVVLGFLLLTGMEPWIAIVVQTLLYTLATRTGAPGRVPYMLFLSLGIGLVGGWLTVATGAIGAAFIGHTITRFSVFLVTGHAGQVGGPGHRGGGAVAPSPHPGRLADHRQPRRPGGVLARPVSEEIGGPLLARPPEALYLHVPFCLSICPYCDFVVVAGSAARGPRARVAGFVARRGRRARTTSRCPGCSIRLARLPWTTRPRVGLSRRRNAVAPARGDAGRARRPHPAALRTRRRCRGDAGSEPRSRRARRGRRDRGGRDHPAVIGANRSTRTSCIASADVTGRRTWR